MQPAPEYRLTDAGREYLTDLEGRTEMVAELRINSFED